MSNAQRTFPPLPAHPYSSWASDVVEAHNTIAIAFNHAEQLLRLEDGDPICLCLHSERLFHRFLPILRVLEREGMDLEWVRAAALSLGSLISDLEESALVIEERPQAPLDRIRPVSLDMTGIAGRPSISIDKNWLSEAISPQRRLSYQVISNLLGIHRNTLRKKLKEAGAPPRFSDISDEELEDLLRKFQEDKNTSGRRYAEAYLRARGYRVQKKRIRLALRQVRGLVSILRNHSAIDRRKYSVPRSNYLWHCDGHHKLIRWGIVIHGIVDGFCRTITGLRASNNNLADTVLSVFEDAVAQYGLPSRVRGDRGGENVKISVYMIKKRGPNRASFMWGSSTRNTRIERLWVEVGSQFARRWRAFFTLLERLHRLDISDQAHLWLLHILFLDQINDDCAAFQLEWNLHPVSGPDMQDKSPADKRFVSLTSHGVDDPELETDTPENLNRYLGTHGAVKHHMGQTRSGAGHPPDEDESDPDSDEDTESDASSYYSSDNNLLEHRTDNDSNDEIAVSQEKHIRHDAIEVPADHCPFQNDEDRMIFITALNKIRNREIIPTGFGAAQSEWEESGYPDAEFIRIGRRQIIVHLPFDIWWPRAVQWVQGLFVLSKVMLEHEIE